MYSARDGRVARKRETWAVSNLVLKQKLLGGKPLFSRVHMTLVYKPVIVASEKIHVLANQSIRQRAKTVW